MALDSARVDEEVPSPPSPHQFDFNDIIAVQPASDLEEPVTEHEPPLKRSRPSSGPADLETCRASAIGVSVETFRLLIMMGFPVICFNMLHYINACMGPLSRTLDDIEYFSGVANIARAFRHNRGTAAEYDYIRSAEHENLCKPSGWMTAFVLTMKLQERGLASWATVCSSWIFMSKSCTGRSRAEPWGTQPGPGLAARDVCQYNGGNPVATRWQDGNTMAARMICTRMLLQARQCTWLLEQPESSVMEYIPEFSYLRMRVQKTKTVMGAFGHHERKGTTLLSCHDWHKALGKGLPPGYVPKKAILDLQGKSRWRHREGRYRYNRENQAYTQEYARAVFEAHREWLKRDDVEFLSEDCEGATYVEAKIPHCQFEDPAQGRAGSLRI